MMYDKSIIAFAILLRIIWGFLTDHPQGPTKKKTQPEKQWRSEEFMADTQLLPGYGAPLKVNNVSPV